MRSRPHRHGFSLIEALVVLAIGGMALSIIFSIGIKAGDSGFGLGRRAMAAADSDLAYSDLRTILRSIALRPASSFNPEVDQPVEGSFDRLSSDVVMERGTQCAPQGWAGRMTLEIAARGNEQTVSCEVAGRRVVLLAVPGDQMAFSYSADGLTWTSTYSNAPAANRDPADFRSERIWIRLAAAPQPDVVELATSGAPETWTRNDGV